MKTTVTALALAALSFTAVSAFADDADPSGQFAASAGSQVQAQQYVRGAVNPWATSYNPVNGYKGQRTRADVTAEFLASRKAVEAFTGEDSGSAYLAAIKTPAYANRQLAGTPVNAQ